MATQRKSYDFSRMLKYNIEQITGTLACGEGLHWDSLKKCMLFCDIHNSTVYRYAPKTKELFYAKVDAPFVSFIIPLAGTVDKYVIGIGRSVALMKWDGVSSNIKKSEIEVIHTVEADKPKNRFNDGKCDPIGRLIAGTMGSQVNGVWEEKQGSVYIMGKDKKLKFVFNEVGISNGLCWSIDGKTLYYVDSLKYTVDCFSYNVQNGELTNRKVLFDLRQNGIEGIPDGMTIDAQGNLWVALYGGYGVICINPKTQKLVTKVPVPGKYITCVQFGGENYEDMYVTSATVETPQQEINNASYLGGTFIITGYGVRGVESNAMAL